MTLEQLGAAAGLDFRAVSKLERGQVPLWPKYRARLASALGVRPEVL